MITRRRSENLIIIAFLCFLVLSACQRAQTPEVTPIPPSSTVTMVPNTDPTPPELEKTEASGVTYPGPQVSLPTDLSVEAYPQPVSGATPVPGASQGSTPTTTGMAVPTSPGAYPQPGSTDQPGNEPYPGPTSMIVLDTPGVSIQPTIAEATSAPELTPTATPTLGLLSTKLVATNPKTFNLASGELQLVEFFAFWSPESKSMAPVMNILEQRLADRLRFVYLDIDDPANSLYKTLLTKRLPPVFFLLDGQGNVLHEWQGYLELDEFEAAIAEALQS